jgi:cbb3-type cytochrome oxidase cytochrome c subunit
MIEALRARIDLGILSLSAGAFAAFVAMMAVGYGAPLADGALGRTSDYTVSYSDEARRGKAIYDSEGCWYCHTQNVRAVPGDVGLGRVTTPDRVARDKPSVIGMSRIGPDLACVGDRITEETPIADLVRNARAENPDSIMPSYRYLTDAQLADLVAYLSALRCEAGAGG